MTTSIDRRTRFAGAAMVMDAEHLFADLSERLQDTGRLAAPRRRAARPAPVDPGGRRHRCASRGRRRRAARCARGVPTTGRSSRSTPPRARSCSRTSSRRSGSSCPAASRCAPCSADQFVAWEPALRAAIDGRPVYEPGSIGIQRPRPATPSTCTSRSASTTTRRGHRPLPCRGGLPAPRRGVHRGGDGGGVGRTRRRRSRPPSATTARRGGPGRRGRLVSVAHPRLQPQIADPAGAARVGPVPIASARSPTTP